jgi:pantoate--beta-alanine ligase
MSPTVPVIRQLGALRAQVGAWRRAGEPVALVPTMGALHEGHLSLVRLARQRCRRVVVSIFVNPTQFAPNEDFARYPRDEAGDLAKLASADCDLVWSPPAAVMYPDGFATRVAPAGAAEGLESDFRPHFFGGVATVCCKLFMQVGADVAVFGEKDYQQLCVVRQMARDLDLPLEIAGAPTVREASGLAMSSRNAYLTPEQRRVAPQMQSSLAAVSARVGAGESCESAADAARQELARAGFDPIDYVEVRDAATLGAPTPGSGRPFRVLAAAWLGKTRLIDNVAAEMNSHAAAGTTGR